jgi:hypothetical protein
MPFDDRSATRLVRPRLLTAAARSGAAMYRRERDLAGLLAGVTGGRNLVERLMEAEGMAETERLAQAPSYSPARHVKLLSALMAEMRAALPAIPGAAPKIEAVAA